MSWRLFAGYQGDTHTHTCMDFNTLIHITSLRQGRLSRAHMSFAGYQELIYTHTCIHINTSIHITATGTAISSSWPHSQAIKGSPSAPAQHHSGGFSLIRRCPLSKADCLSIDSFQTHTRICIYTHMSCVCMCVYIHM